MEKQFYSIPEARAYLEHRIGRDALYDFAHSGKVAVVWVGRSKLLFPKSSLDQIMAGEITLEAKK